MFNARNSIVCDTSFNECIRYSSADLVNDDYILTSNSTIEGNESLYLTKFNTNKFEEILSFDDNYIQKYFDDKMFFIINQNNNETNTLLIRYNFK